MAEMQCSGCGEKKRTFSMPLGARIINHQRAGAPELVKEMRRARAVLQVPDEDKLDPTEDSVEAVEDRLAAYKDLALATADNDLAKTAIFDAALALIERAHHPETTSDVMVEVTIAVPTLEPCPGSGKAPQS